MSNETRIFFVIPAYNEGTKVGEVVRNVRAKFPHVVVVDDGSKDNTGESARQAGATVLMHLLNRGQAGRAVPEGAHLLLADARDRASVVRALGSMRFDAVVSWISFVPEHVEADVELFRDRTAQYILISSATVYQKPVPRLPITESTPLGNPFWDYARGKIGCEERLMGAYCTARFPATIVRPSHTYDRTKVPLFGY